MGGWQEEKGKRKWSMRRCQRTFNGLCKPNTWTLVSRVKFNIPPSFPSSPSHPSTMSDKTTGYRLEYSSSNRAKCKGLNIFLCIRLCRPNAHCGLFIQLMLVDVRIPGPKPCSGLLFCLPLSPNLSSYFIIGTAINKGELRFGTLVEFRGNQSLCVISRVSPPLLSAG